MTTIGPDFDRALVIKGQQDLISLHESEASGGQDGRSKHSHEVLPMLPLHLKKAEALGHKIGV